MFSAAHKLKGRLLSFRLVAGYFILFFVSTVLLFTFSMTLLENNITDIERQRVVDKVDFYQALQKESGFSSLAAEIRKQHKSNKLGNLYIHLTDLNGETLWQTTPFQLDELSSDFFTTTFTFSPNSWQFIDLPIENDLDIYSHVLPGGQIIQVGRTTARQEVLIEDIRNIFIGVLLAIALFGMAGGLFMAYQVLRPVRHLTQTAKQVYSGDMTSRVPIDDPNGELADLAEIINAMLQRIETLMIAMRDSLNNLGHDLRTPLARMKARIETAIIEGNSPENQRETLLDCAEEIERINQLITMLMDIAEAETGQMRLNKTSFSTTELLKEIAELYDLVAEEKNISIVIDTEDFQLFADRQRMAQVVGNLTDNAIKYTPEGGTVTLKASSTPSETSISVQDTGPGIPQEERKRIFDKLYRIDKSRSTKGIGLGLSLVHAVLSTHKASITVSDAPGGGCLFKVIFPPNKGQDFTDVMFL